MALKITISSAEARVSSDFNENLRVEGAAAGDLYKFQVDGLPADIKWDDSGNVHGRPKAPHDSFRFTAYAKKVKSLTEVANFDFSDVQSQIEFVIKPALRMVPENGDPHLNFRSNSPVNVQFEVLDEKGTPIKDGYEWEEVKEFTNLPKDVIFAAGKLTGKPKDIPALDQSEPGFERDGSMHSIKIRAKNTKHKNMDAETGQLTLHTYPPMELHFREEHPGKVNVAYHGRIEVKYAHHCRVTYRMELKSGIKPQDFPLKIDEHTGVISGTPPKAGVYSVTFTVTDDGGYVATLSQKIRIHTKTPLLLVPPSMPSNQAAFIGVEFKLKLSAQNGFNAVKYRLISKLPDNPENDFKIDSNGLITGRATLKLREMLDTENPAVVLEVGAIDDAELTNVADDGKGTRYVIPIAEKVSLHRMSIVGTPQGYVGRTTHIDLARGASGFPFTGVDLLEPIPPSIRVYRKGSTIVDFTPKQSGSETIKFKLNNKYSYSEGAITVHAVDDAPLALHYIEPKKIRPGDKFGFELSFDAQYKGEIFSVLHDPSQYAEIGVDLSVRPPKMNVNVHKNVHIESFDIHYALIGSGGRSSDVGTLKVLVDHG
ncbi:Ig domain-containing protein [Burkholderia orbicola]|uniref:Ig domain-containing protein n=1 Tax=Burkholderia orbicola TaxID=2978683 RepID=UPI002FE095A4